MPRNLISLKTFYVEGYKHSGSHRVLKVSKGSLTHKIGDMNSAKLYVLRCSALTGTVVVDAISDERSKINLWKMRLGHMSEHAHVRIAQERPARWLQFEKLEFCERCIFGKHKRVKIQCLCSYH
jgi:hypothetical protein